MDTQINRGEAMREKTSMTTVYLKWSKTSPVLFRETSNILAELTTVRGFSTRDKQNYVYGN